MKKKVFFVVFLAFITVVSAHAGIISMTSETTISDAAGVNDAVSAVIDSNNKQHLIWTYNDGSIAPYYTCSSDSGSSWSPKVRMTDEGVSMALITNSSGTSIYTLYAGNLSGNPKLYFNKSTDSGATFPVSNEVLLSDSKETATASLVMDSNGYLYAVWDSNETGDYDIYFSYSANDGATFSTPKVVNTPSNSDQTKPSIFVDSNNVLYVTWHSNHNADKQIYMMATSDKGLTFGDGKTSGQEVQVTFAGSDVNKVVDYHAQYYPGIGLSIAYACIDNTAPTPLTKVFFNRQKIMHDGTIYFNSTSNQLVGSYVDNIGVTIQTRLIFNGEGTVYCFVTTDDTSDPFVKVFYSTDLAEFKSLTYVEDSLLSCSSRLGVAYSSTNDLFFDSYGDLFFHYLYGIGADAVKSMKIVFAFPDDKITGTVTDGETDVDPTATFSFTFSDDLLSTSITSSNIKLLDEAGGLVSTYKTYSYGNSTTIKIDPTSDLLNGTNYVIRFVSKKVNYPDGLQNKDGVGFNGGEDLVISFRTTETCQTAFTSFKAYPNPVTGSSVQIRFKSGFALDATETKVDIYNVNEERVKSIYTWTDHGSNEYSTIWDTTNYDLIDVYSGVYYYRITAWNSSNSNRIQETGKILLIR